MPPSTRSRSPTSSVATSGQRFTTDTPTRATRLSHLPHNDSTDSLRNLELTDGPMTAPTAKRHGRLRSFSFSGFNFQADLLPLSETISDADGSFRETPGAEKSISLVHGIGLVVGSQIGSGIFSSPGVIVANTHSVGASLAVWFASGLLAWTGASSFAELGSSIPLDGGAQAYLSYAYGPLVSYLFAWTAISALRPGGSAAISLIFAEYLNRLMWHITQDQVSPDGVPQWSIKLTAAIAVIVVAIICSATRNMGTRASVLLTAIKICSLILITILGLFQLIRGRASESFKEPLFENSSTSPSEYSLAFYSGLWAFDGWDQVNYVGGEMYNPEKNIPRTIHFSMVIVGILFLVANVSYLVVLDKATVASSNAVALDFGRAIFGPVGGAVFAILVAVSCFGALNGGTFTSARLIRAAGREGFLPAVFGKLNKSRKTPVNAIVLQTTMTIMFIVVGGGFRSLINFSVVASWSFYFLTVLGLVILRVKEPNLERPYKTWIITPLIFCAVALFLLCMPIIAAPLEAMAVLGFVLAGVPVYYLTRKDEQSKISFSLNLLGACVDRVRGRPNTSGGWQAVSTESDEVEMRTSSR